MLRDCLLVLIVCAAASMASRAPLADANEFFVTPITEGVSFGPVPAAKRDFAALAERGITTIVSVDAATPDVAAAAEHGIRTIHIPTRYSGLSTDQHRSLAAALYRANAPVFVHCHHGAHRAPTAAAAALIALGKIDTVAGAEVLAAAGTSPSYPGLHACVREAEPMTAEAIARLVEIELHEVAPVTGTAGGMATIDHAWDVLAVVRASGWRVPEDHPDAVPAAEAGLVRDVLRSLAELPEEDAEYAGLMARSVDEAGALEQALVSGDALAAEAAYTALGTTCIACHKGYRNAAAQSR